MADKKPQVQKPRESIFKRGQEVQPKPPKVTVDSKPITTPPAPPKDTKK